ncbi:MAG: acyl-ACP--UDP-N-acetylglucosamine O-acyltransferase [Desulfobacterales bacterium]|nr:acyl-ACP--UDP-N-acetylglucosamine O-acyltransferase [Desulfobacterales bacterium]MDJ0876248.1 acyl-ACP--UDP-N-acetylglucosamine O-acyltransferase [Desulfobacterales bacterium]MDJ0882721.1 acyl-ACP--UDP-N-acetylglucosamine O-acyltransferase [Desulfobacterales bacterium]
MIHPTAIVSSRAVIGSNVEIGPYAIIGANVTIGDGTVIGAHTTVDPFVDIGPECHIFQFASVGALPQAIKFGGEKTYVKIGRRTVIREFATVNRGTGFGGGVTEVGEENLLMAYVHIAHDCKTGRGVILANNATLAGHVCIDDYVTVGGLTAIHQFVRVGRHAYIGGKSAVVKDIPPYVIAAGDRARLHGLNRVGLRRHGHSEKAIAMLKRTYRLIFRIGITLNEAIERVKAEVDQTPEVKRFMAFIKSSQRGITR